MPAYFRTRCWPRCPDGAGVVGFGCCGSQRSETLKETGYAGEIGAIYVLRAFQRRGLGGRLMSIMASDLMSRSRSTASLWVLKKMR
jgi:ribosomal protein S18 acetylase RimI-like enzyme